MEDKEKMQKDRQVVVLTITAVDSDTDLDILIRDQGWDELAITKIM